MPSSGKKVVILQHYPSQNVLPLSLLTLVINLWTFISSLHKLVFNSLICSSTEWDSIQIRKQISCYFLIFPYQVLQIHCSSVV